MPSARPEQCLPVCFVGTALGAENKGSAELGSDGAEVKRGCDTMSIHDASGGNHRQPRTSGQQPRERHRAEAIVLRRGVKNAAMATRLAALGDQRVDSRFSRRL